jgi:hypothetical protein
MKNRVKIIKNKKYRKFQQKESLELCNFLVSSHYIKIFFASIHHNVNSDIYKIYLSQLWETAAPNVDVI